MSLNSSLMPRRCPMVEVAPAHDRCPPGENYRRRVAPRAPPPSAARPAGGRSTPAGTLPAAGCAPAACTRVRLAQVHRTAPPRRHPHRHRPPPTAVQRQCWPLQGLQLHRAAIHRHPAAAPTIAQPLLPPCGPQPRARDASRYEQQAMFVGLRHITLDGALRRPQAFGELRTRSNVINSNFYQHCRPNHLCLHWAGLPRRFVTTPVVLNLQARFRRHRADCTSPATRRIR